MQKLIETLKSFGIEIPEDKQTEVKAALSEHYKNVAEHQKVLKKLEADRDNWKTRAETAEDTLKGFEGVDLQTMQTELADWKKKAEDAKADYEKQLYDRDFSDALKAELDSVRFTSEAAKKAVTAEIKEAGLKLKDGKILGLSDLIGQIRQTDSSAFVDEHQEDLEKGRARFTQPKGNDTGGTPLSKNDILAIKDPKARQDAIATHLDLFGKA